MLASQRTRAALEAAQSKLHGYQCQGANEMGRQQVCLCPQCLGCALPTQRVLWLGMERAGALLGRIAFVAALLCTAVFTVVRS